MTAEVDAEPKGSGRRKLQGVLDILVQKSRETDEKLPGETVEDSAVEEAAKSLVELPNSIPTEDLSPVKRKGYRVSPRKRKKRRKKEFISASDESEGELRDGSESNRHIPHVMTMFDRRVDLARFTDSTPLYVMCRDWMRNKPQRRQQSSGVFGKKVNDDQHVQSSFSLPSPQPILEGHSTNVPPSLSPHGGTSGNLDQQMEKQLAAVNGEDCSIQNLKQQHLQRWKTVRSRWASASFSDQERYKDSLKILKDMFQR